MTSEIKLKRALHTIDILLGIIVCLIFFGQMTFGGGLGDLFPAMILLAYIMANTVLAYVVKDKFFLIMLLVISIAVFCWTTWGLTLGRGNEYKWNGKILIE